MTPIQVTRSSYGDRVAIQGRWRIVSHLPWVGTRSYSSYHCEEFIQEGLGWVLTDDMPKDVEEQLVKALKEEL